MATKLTKPVSREIEINDVHGNVGPVIATMTARGIILRGKGTKRQFTIAWESLRSAIKAPVVMPARFSANVMGWLIERNR